MATTVRSLTVADSADAISLWHETGLIEPTSDAAVDFARSISAENSDILGAFDDDGSLIATAMVGYDGQSGAIYYLSIVEAVRRSGVGLKILRAAEDWLKERGAPRVRVIFPKSIDSPTGFYAALGYEPSDVTVLSKQLGG